MTTQETFRPSAADCAIIREIAKGRAEIHAGRRGVTLEPGLRFNVDTGETAPDVNGLHVTQCESHGDTDLADHRTWADFRAGFALVRGVAVVDFYVSTVDGLACNVVALFDADGLAGLWESGVNCGPALWTRPGADVTAAHAAAYPAGRFATGEPVDMEGNARPSPAAAVIIRDTDAGTLKGADAPALTSREQFATVWTHGGPDARAVATVSAPRMIGDTGGGFFRLSDTDGRTLKTWTRRPRVADVRNALDTVAHARREAEERAADMTDADLADAFNVNRDHARTTEERASKRAARENGRALLHNLAALAAVRADAFRGVMEARAADVARAMPGTVPAFDTPTAATPRGLVEGERDAFKGRDGSPARVTPRGLARAALADAMAADAHALARDCGAFPSRALAALADRTAAAIEEGLALFSDPADPFESVRDFVGYPEARETLAWADAGGPAHITRAGLARADESPEEAAAAFAALAGR